MNEFDLGELDEAELADLLYRVAEEIESRFMQHAGEPEAYKQIPF